MSKVKAFNHKCQKHYCRYLYMALPELSDNAVLVIGPYLCAPFVQEQFLETSEKLRVVPAQKDLLQGFYTNLPVMADNNPLLMVLDTFCEHLWGINNYSVEDIDKEIMSAIETALWDDSVGNVRKKEYKLGLEWLYRKVTEK